MALQTPRVERDRTEQWATDLEFGRQALAGMNPCMLAALKTLPAEFGSAIEAKHVDGGLMDC
jgi:threonine/homoserine efflux transporter RhtA